MTRDPFVRLALIAAVSLWLVGLAVVAQLLGWPAAVAAGLVGVLGAAALSVELAPSNDVEKEEVGPGDGPKQRQPEQGTRGFLRIR